MRGRLIVFEGLDASGKTTIIREIMKRKDDCAYSKGLGSESWLGRLVSEHPSTFLFLTDMIHSQRKDILPLLREGKDVLQDRYVFSLYSYLPASKHLHNKLLLSAFEKYLLKPDLLFYVTVSDEERIVRLKKAKESVHHTNLIRNPGLMRMMDDKYCSCYESFKGEKYLIDTTDRSIDYVVQEVMSRL